ncbi:Uncharacterised protein [Nocardia brasiliensis]|nr:Uncharacterised protein [Nocardia brasiliensis]
MTQPNKAFRATEHPPEWHSVQGCSHGSPAVRATKHATHGAAVTLKALAAPRFPWPNG